MARRELNGGLVPEPNVERTDDDPAESEIGYGEAPLRLVLSGTDGSRLSRDDTDDEFAEVRTSGRRERAEDVSQTPSVRVAGGAAEMVPRGLRLLDVEDAEVDEIDFCGDSAEDFGCCTQARLLCDDCTDAADCASRGARCRCFVS
jgi:hypothetical protein